MYNSPLQRNRRIGNLEGSRVLENTLNAATIRNHEQILARHEKTSLSSVKGVGKGV